MGTEDSELNRLFMRRSALHQKVADRIFRFDDERRQRQELGVFLSALTIEELERGLRDSLDTGKVPAVAA